MQNLFVFNCCRGKQNDHAYCFDCSIHCFVGFPSFCRCAAIFPEPANLNIIHIMSGPLFALKQQSQAFDLSAVLRARGHNIDPGGIDAAVAKNVRQLGNVLFNGIKGPGEQLAQIMGKHLAAAYSCPAAQFLHPGPDTAPAEGFSVSAAKDHAGADFFCFAYFRSSLCSFPGSRIVRVFPLQLTTICPVCTFSTVKYCSSETRIPVAQMVCINS